MDARMLRNLIGRLEPATPLYRIVRLKRLRESLQDKQTALVPTSVWDDPLEDPLARIAISYMNESVFRQEFFDQTRKPTFAQCWSLRPESDTMWRAYSVVRKDPPTKECTSSVEGVKVRTTAKKLLSALWAACPAEPENACFLGQVQYGPKDGIMQYIVGEVRRERLQAFSGGIGHAKSLLMKRNEFSNEEEVRLIYVEHRSDEAPASIFPISIEPNDFIDEIILDPRLNMTDVREREQEFRELGFTGIISRSQLYQRTLFEIIIE